jgi:AraC-like DNA-binding protein
MDKTSKLRFETLPTSTGAITRAAYARALQARLDVAPLLRHAGLTVEQVEDPRVRIGVGNQIRFLDLVANAIGDEFLGVRLAQEFELREMGLLYYVQASSETLGDALQRVARYSSIHNEGVRIRYRQRNDMSIAFEYAGVARLKDCHQIEFFVTVLVRICRHLTGHHVSPSRVKLMHRRAELPSDFKALLGCDVAFGSDVDEVAYSASTERLPTVNPDPYLNNLLLKYCDEALSNRRADASAWRLNVENAVAPLLPHGRARVAEISRRLGVSRRTLARRLASEGMTFAEVLDGLRSDLARRYLQESDLPMSKVAWLLGYRETSAFNHAFKRWTGETPRQVRSRGSAPRSAA